MDLAFRIKGSGKVRRLSLGAFPEFTLDQARDRANALTSAARDRRDLIAEEAHARAEDDARVTVGRLIEMYVRRRVAKLRTAKEIEARLRRTLASLIDQPAEAIRRRVIRALLDEVADAGFEREAEKRRQSVGAMFRWGLSQDLVENDPTAGLAAFDPGTPRERVLTADEIELLWPWLDIAGFPRAYADIIRLQLALGSRCGEVAGIRAEEIDVSAWIWTLPPERSKNAKARTTPIVGLAREILERRLGRTKRGPLFLTETQKPLTSSHVGNAIGHRLKRLPIAVFVTHDLRRTVATMMVEMGIPLETVAAVIGHEAGGRETRTLVRHYVRTDQIERKRVVLEAWDRRLSSIIAGNADSNVTQLTDHKKAVS